MCIYTLNSFYIYQIHVCTSDVFPPARPVSRARLHELPQSEIMDELLDQIGVGLCHFAGAHRMASACVRERVQSPAVCKFASLGNSGQYLNNVERDAHVWLQDCVSIVPDISFIFYIQYIASIGNAYSFCSYCICAAYIYTQISHSTDTINSIVRIVCLMCGYMVDALWIVPYIYTAIHLYDYK